MMVAGTTIATELKKNGSIPLQVPPTQNLLQAKDQYSSEKLCGRLIRPLRLKSGRLRKELRIRRQAAPHNRARTVRAAHRRRVSPDGGARCPPRQADHKR